MESSYQDVVYYIDERDDGSTVGNLLRRKGFSHTLVRKLKREGEVRVNGVSVYMRDKVIVGDLVVVKFPPDGQTTVEPENIPLQILHEDNDILAINKPAGQLVHPVRHEQNGTLANAVLYYWREKGISARFRPVYRLDRDTSGIVLVANGHLAAQQLVHQLETRVLRRRYLAVIQDIPDSQGTINLPLALKKGCTAQWEVATEGKRAVTHFKLVRILRGAALLSLELETGRTHQIRVHMTHIGHPLIGDVRYGEKSALLDRQALHAVAIDYNHPRTGVPVKLRCPLPEDMRKLVQSLAH